RRGARPRRWARRRRARRTPRGRPRARARGCAQRRRAAAAGRDRRACRPSAQHRAPSDLTSGTIVPYSSNRSHGSDSSSSSSGVPMTALTSVLAPPGRRHVNPWLVLTLVCLAQFMVILDATIVNVALPTLQEDLHFTPSSLQWVVNAYTLIFGGFLLLGGRAADLFGRRRLFLAGVAAFTAASLLDGLATGSTTLI